jgi:xanthine dehydrogenase FAD-binding subunit
MRNILLPHTLDDLWEILYSEPGPHVYAGGTDLLVKLRSLSPSSLLSPAPRCPDPLTVQLFRPPAPLVCLERIEELKGVYEEDRLVCIRACTTHTEIMNDPVVRRHFPVLPGALRLLGSPQIRNMGTIGGNICTASPAGDTLTPLYVLGASIETRSCDGGRLMPLKSFILGPGSTALQKGEILYGIWITKDQDFNVHHFEKVGQRKALSIAIASMAVLARLSGEGTIEKIRLAWGSVAPTVISSRTIEDALTGKPLTEKVLRDVMPLAADAVSPIDDVRASAEYRRMAAANLLLRLLQYRDAGSKGPRVQGEILS